MSLQMCSLCKRCVNKWLKVMLKKEQHSWELEICAQREFGILNRPVVIPKPRSYCRKCRWRRGLRVSKLDENMHIHCSSATADALWPFISRCFCTQSGLWAESASYTVTSYISGFIAGCNFLVRLFSDCTYLGVLHMCVCDPL